MQRRMVAGIAALAIVLANMLLPAMPVFASHGNNGTLKVHEKGTPSGTESNDPKVCTFNFEGFGFDDYMSGYIVIKGQGQTNGTYGPYAFGPTNNHGYAQTSYFNDGIGSTTIPNGHYKATLYGKKNGQINYQDDKAKSKVFKIECAAPVKDASAGLNLTQATCESKSVASVVNLVNAALTSNGGVLDQTVGTHTAIFTAVPGHLFTSNNQTILQVPYTIAAQLTGKRCEEGPKKPVIKATVQCTTVDGKIKIGVTLTNSGDLEGSADVNGESIGLDPAETTTVYLDSGSHVLVTFDYPDDNSDTVLYNQALTCEPGRGGETPETPKTPEVPVVLPYTAGASTPIVAISALSVASLILVAGAAIKSRLLA